MGPTVAISGASGKTGYRIAEELLARGDSRRLELIDAADLDDAPRGADALIIATGARPSPDLTTPLRVDDWGVQRQVDSCRRVGVQRMLLVGSLCAGRWLHPLNLFGLILVWKRLGERALDSPAAMGRILEVTSSPSLPPVGLERVLAAAT